VISAIRHQAPHIGVVLVVSTLDPQLLVDAMRAGVNEVVADPVTTDDVKKAIERVAGERTHVEAGKIYGFVGAKGGVGTTTIAVNVATALGAISKPARCLIIDCHRTGGDASLFLGAEPRFSIVDALQNTHRLDHVFFKNLVTQVAPSTDLLASPEHASAGSFDDGIQRVLSSASFIYKHTVLDLTRSDDTVLHSLDLLTTIYIVANQELATVKSTNRLAATLRERYGRGKVGLVLSRSDGQADIGQADVEKAAGCAVVCAFPSDYRMALQALNKGRPLALENHNELSTSLKRFAYQLAGERPARDGARPSGLFGRLTHSRS
jgi:pilus assembly protein CpaE